MISMSGIIARCGRGHLGLRGQAAAVRISRGGIPRDGKAFLSSYSRSLLSHREKDELNELIAGSRRLPLGTVLLFGQVPFNIDADKRQARYTIQFGDHPH